MKKLYPAIPWIIIVILCGFHLFKSKPIPDTKASEAAIQDIKSDRDSLVKVIFLKTDTIEAVRHRMNSLEFQLVKAETLRQKNENRKIEKPFVRTDDDRERDAILAELYVTFRPVR